MTRISSEMREAAVKLGLQIRDRVERALEKCHADLGADFFQTVARCGVGTDPDGLGVFVLIDGALVWRGGWKRDELKFQWVEEWLREPKEFAR